MSGRRPIKTVTACRFRRKPLKAKTRTGRGRMARSRNRDAVIGGPKARPQVLAPRRSYAWAPTGMTFAGHIAAPCPYPASGSALQGRSNASFNDIARRGPPVARRRASAPSPSRATAAADHCAIPHQPMPCDILRHCGKHPAIRLRTSSRGCSLLQMRLVIHEPPAHRR